MASVLFEGVVSAVLRVESLIQVVVVAVSPKVIIIIMGLSAFIQNQVLP